MGGSQSRWLWANKKCVWLGNSHHSNIIYNIRWHQKRVKELKRCRPAAPDAARPPRAPSTKPLPPNSVPSNPPVSNTIIPPTNTKTTRSSPRTRRTALPPRITNPQAPHSPTNPTAASPAVPCSSPKRILLTRIPVRTPSRPRTTPSANCRRSPPAAR